MSSTPIDELRHTIGRVQRHRSRMLILRETALGLAFLAALFAGLASLETAFEFQPAGRFVLLIILLIGAGVTVWRYLYVRGRNRADERRIAHYIEEHFPELEQRLITSMEFGEPDAAEVTSLLVGKLWEDTRVKLKAFSPDKLPTGRTAWPAAGAALMMVCFLVFALWNWDHFSRAGGRIILPWTDQEKAATATVGLYVEPGSIRIQRGDDVLFIARIENATPQQVELYFQIDQIDWNRVSMKREGGEHTYVYFLPAVNKDVAYYVDIGLKRSEQHRIAVFDMPRVEGVSVEYEYPPYTGLPKKSVDNRGDVIAPEGTHINFKATFNKTVSRAMVLFGDGTTLELAPDGNTAGGSFIVSRDATYTIKVIDTEQMQNEDPYEYFIRAVPDTQPVVTLVRPGRDRRVMSLEEISIVAQARDDYGLAKFDLNYMVAGGRQHEVPFLEAPRQGLNLAVDGRTTIYLEDLDVKPGDLVLYFFTAVDNNTLKGPSEVVSDIYFLEVIPTAEEFRRAGQQGGGGGAGGRGQPSSALVQNQKNIIAATWKLLKKRTALSQQKFDENVETIAASQREVLSRTQLSLRRLLERFSLSDETYDRAVEHLKQAVGHMEEAATELTNRKLGQALAPEQSALQAIMKAQAESRKTTIQLARNRSARSGGNGQQQERQDLRELFEMEMGRLENRYELPQQATDPQPDAEKEDTLAKLRDLARRQDRLNRDQSEFARRRDHMTEEQIKRHLEQLRREQEELSRQARELSQQMSRLARREGMRQWSDRQRKLDQATRQMQEAARSFGRRESDTALAKGQQASENLRDQEREMSLEQRATVSNLIDALSRKAQALRLKEKQILKSLQDLQPETNGLAKQMDAQSIQEIQEVLADKDKLQRELAETEAMLRTLEKKGRQDQPEVADRAGVARRAIESEGIAKNIEESREFLQQGLLGPSKDLEKKIDQSIDRVSKGLQELDRRIPRSREDQLRQAAVDAGSLRRELENLRNQIEALRQGNHRMKRTLSKPDQEKGSQAGTAANEGRNSLEDMRQSLQRSRRYARGLVQPWARGERWGIDARSIQRQLTQKEIEDFLSQPDLWQKVLKPVKELESALQAEADVSRLKNKLFLGAEAQVPALYRQLVEEYYRDLSRGDTKP